jgi:hypothetical protein
MSPSETVYRTLLFVYPVEHRRAYGDAMVQLFRDRMRRDGGGFGTLMVWTRVGFDLAASAFKERMETIMATENWTNRWWETSVVLLAVNSVVFGFLFANNDHLGWGIAVGFVPGVLLIAGLAMRSRQRIGATIFLTVGSVAAAVAWWVIYTVVLAVAIVVGGFWTSKIGPKRTNPKAAVA